MARVIPNVEVLAAGTWDGRDGRWTFTPRDLVDAVDASHCPLVGDPLVKIGHDGDITVGRVRNLRLSPGGDKVTGDMHLPGWLAQVCASAYPARSPEVLGQAGCGGHGHPSVIVAVALLGVTEPAMPLNRLDLDAGETLFCGSRGEDMSEDGHFTISSDEMHLAIREGRISAEGAAEMLEGTVRAHSNEHARQRAHQAIDQAFGQGGDDKIDEFGRLFNPSNPLGPPSETEDMTHFTPKKRTRVELHQKRHASAGEPLTDDEAVFAEMFGFTPPPEYFED